ETEGAARIVSIAAACRVAVEIRVRTEVYVDSCVGRRQHGDLAFDSDDGGAVCRRAARGERGPPLAHALAAAAPGVVRVRTDQGRARRDEAVAIEIDAPRAPVDVVTEVPLVQVGVVRRVRGAGEIAVLDERIVVQRPGPRSVAEADAGIRIGVV